MTVGRRYLVRGLAVGSVLVAIGMAGLPSPSRMLGPSDDSVSSVGFQELKKTLLEVRRTWNPNGKPRIVDRSEHWAEVFEAPLKWLLDRPRHNLIVEAIYLAGELRVLSVREQIVQLAWRGPASRRAVAVAAAEHIEPWSLLELEDFLSDRSEEVRVAALDVLATRDDRPLDQFLTALQSDSEAVRKAALGAIPPVLSAEDLQVLFAMIDNATDEEAVRLLPTLEKLEMTEDVEAFLTSRLLTSEPEMQEQSLEMLGAKGSKLLDPNAVWNVAVDIGQPRDVRARAMLCLERTGSCNLQKLKENRELNDPVLNYFVARCLIDSGEREGAERLLEILNEEAGGMLDEAKRAELLIAAGKLLGHMSETSSGAGIEVWSQWYWYGGPASKRQLPPPPFGW